MPELQSFDIHLHNLHGPLPIQAVRAHALNGLFHAELGKRHPAVVEAMHQADGPAPFSLAPLFNEAHFLGFRVGTLTTDFGQRIAEVWGGLAAQRADVQLGSAQLCVEDVKPGRSRATTYEQLLADAPAAHGLRLRFETPVRLKTFGQSGLLPTPQAVWQFYAQRWEKFAPMPLPPELVRWAGRRVQATDLALETRYAYIEKSVEWKGVMGEIEYQAFTDDDRDVPSSRLPDYLRAWQALALLAEFCGTGEKATMGMGRTHRVKVFGEHRTKANASN